MEEQLAELAAKVAALESSGSATNTSFAEMFYYITIPLMIIIHAGFLAYEMGASRLKNVLASGVKNILAFAFMVPTMFLFGFFVYWAWTPGLIPTAESWQVGVDFANPFGEVMGPHLGDQITGVFWGAFTLFACTTASIFSGAVIERIQVVGFIILAVVLGSFAWLVAAAWGWSAGGWLKDRGAAASPFFCIEGVGRRRRQLRGARDRGSESGWCGFALVGAPARSEAARRLP